MKNEVSSSDCGHDDDDNHKEEEGEGSLGSFAAEGDGRDRNNLPSTAAAASEEQEASQQQQQQQVNAIQDEKLNGSNNADTTNASANNAGMNQHAPLTAHAAPYLPAVAHHACAHPIPPMPPMLPPVPTMQVPVPIPVQVPTVMNMPVDPLLQVQFYEARMRDHAAAFAQYANAAAGAALAAAHMANATANATVSVANIPGTASTPFMPSFYPTNATSNHDVQFQPHSSDFNANGVNTNPSTHVHAHQSQHTNPNTTNHRQSFGVTMNARTPFYASHQQDRSGKKRNNNNNAHPKKRSQQNTSHSHAHRNRQLPSSEIEGNYTYIPLRYQEQDHSYQYQSNRRTRRRKEHNEHINNTNHDADNLWSAQSEVASRPQSQQNHQNLKKKTKRSSANTSQSSNSTMKSFFLMGKTGVSALHDLCNKKRWSPPKFAQVPTDVLQQQQQQQQHNEDRDNYEHGDDDTGGATPPTSTATRIHIEFIISVEVNGVELSRGRGGSKKSAQQDAARKALSVLYPGCCFDANGILLDLGKIDESNAVFSGRGRYSYRYDQDQESNNCLKDLEANMASRLSIDGNSTSASASRNGRISPVPSEDSSISTTVSMAKGKPAPLVTGGPFIQMKDRARHRLTFPSASTTSGISSASEDVDDDEYLASRGASVCSALLNVMVQIDKRIREQPTYTFDVCTNPATIAQQQQHDEKLRNNELEGQKSSKRKGVGFSGVGGAIVSKRRSATNAVGRTVTIHRSSFACTVSLTLYIAKKAGTNSSLEPKTTKKREGDDNISKGERKTNAQPTKESVSTNEEQTAAKTLKKPCMDSSDEISTERLQAVGTGATKREARHIASAKLLAMLFPECNGMVEVKAAAEAAREQYAANRARLKRAAQSDGGKFTKRERRRKVKNDSNVDEDKLSLASPKPNDPPLPEWFSKRLLLYTDINVGKTVESAPTSDGMAKLSLSESGDQTDSNTKYSGTTEKVTSNDTNLQLSRQKQFEEKIDAALQLLHENDDERKTLLSSFKDNELSKTILRRATAEDVESLERLLSKEERGQDGKSSPSTSRPADFSSISPLSLIGILTNNASPEFLARDVDISTIASQLWGNQSVVLILSRAIASQDEPPLGCAVMSLGFSLSQGRILRINEIRNEIHFPKERLIECLEELGNKMECSVEVRNQKKEMNTGIFFNTDNLQTIVRKYTKKGGEDIDSESSPKHSTSIHRRPLQSVKEEDNEDDDAKSDHLHHKRAKLI